MSPLHFYIVVFFVIPILILIIKPFRKIYFLEEYTLETTISTKPLPKRDLFSDALKGFAIIAVIVIHAQFLYLEIAKDRLDLLNEGLITLISNLGRFTIPFFLFASGLFLSYNKKEGYLKYLKRRLLQITVPFILIAVAITLLKGLSFSNWAHQILTAQNPSFAPFYFAILITQLYILFPLIKKLSQFKWFLYFSFTISLAFEIVTLLSPELLHLHDFTTSFFMRFLFFFVFGVYTRKHFLENKIQLKTKELFFWITLIVIFIVAIVMLGCTVYNIRFLYGIAMINIFFALKEYALKNSKKMLNFFAAFGKISLWIFLTHIFFEEIILRKLLEFNAPVLLNFLLTIVLTTLISFFVAKILSYGYKKVLSLVL